MAPWATACAALWVGAATGCEPSTEDDDAVANGDDDNGDDDTNLGDDTNGDDDTSLGDDTGVDDDSSSPDDDSTPPVDDDASADDDSSATDDDSTGPPDDDSSLADDDSAASDDDSTGDDDTGPDDDATGVDDDTTPVDDDTSAVPDDDSSPLDDDTTPSDDDMTLPDDDSTVVDDDSTVPSDDDSSGAVGTADVHDIAAEAFAVIRETYPLSEGSWMFGATVAIDGDVNGDGWDDLLVVEAGDVLLLYDWPAFRQGTVVYFGPVSGEMTTADADIVFVTDEPGYSHPTAGMADLNADGWDDVYVYGTDGVYLFWGPLGGTRYEQPDADAVLWLPGVYFSEMSELGDVNGDGWVDLGIARTSPEGAWVLFGPFSGDVDVASAAQSTWMDTDGSGLFPKLIRAAGDVDGDGLDDILLGAPHYDGDLGAACLVYGPPADGVHGVADTDVRFVGEQPGSYVGYSMAGGFDFNGDGFDEFAALAPGFELDGEIHTTTYILDGTPDRYSGDLWLADISNRVVARVTLDGGDLYHGLTDLRGDMTGDALPDLALSDYLDREDGDAAIVGVVSGPLDGATDLDDVDLLWKNPDFDDITRVGGGGDVNGDGYLDVALAHPSRCWVFLVAGAGTSP